MKRQLPYKFLFALLILTLLLTSTGQAFATSQNISSLSVNTLVLTANRAIASWPSGTTNRPVLVFLPGWGGSGAVDASVSAENTNLVNQGYVTLAIGFNEITTWNSDINSQTLQGLDKLCADATIQANCNAILLVGESFGGIQNDVVIRYLRSNGYSGGGTKKVLGFVSEDAGYVPPGDVIDVAGTFNRTGLADTSNYSVAMIQNLGDTTFPVDDCTWGNCGARVLSNAHQANGNLNVFSICPVGGEHGTRGYANWDAWVTSAIKTIIHVTSGIPTFSGYTPPTLTVSNACVTTPVTVTPGLSVSGTNIVANGQPIKLRGANMGDPFMARGSYGSLYTVADYATLAQDWHANIVRISIYPTQWKHMDHPTLLAGLATEINAALNNGMYVIISYHVIGWPDGYYESPCCGNAPDTFDSSMAVATSFWTQMAQTYGTDKRIIFDLWNEPVHQDDINIGVTDPNPKWALLKPFYESLIQTVRTNGSQNIVLASGNRWSSWLVGIKDSPLSDTNVVYAYHKYSVTGLNTPTEWNKDVGGLIGVKPVLVSEWGYEDVDVTNPTWPGTQASYGDPFTQWMDSNNLSSLAWMYHHDWTPAFFKPGGGLTLYGAFAKSYISKNISTPPATFADVPSTYWASSYIGRLYSAGITGGCSAVPLNYCPDSTVTRAQMAVFLLKGMHGSSFAPPDVGGSTGFSDVATSYWAAAWIKQLAAEGITGGCGTGIYCPDASVTRAQMAVFLLKAKHGSAYTPPAATGVFTDVQLVYWAASWIEQLASEGVTSGCGAGTYCPDDSVTRAQMAVFIVKAFGLP